MVIYRFEERRLAMQKSISGAMMMMDMCMDMAMCKSSRALLRDL